MTATAMLLCFLLLGAQDLRTDPRFREACRRYESGERAEAVAELRRLCTARPRDGVAWMLVTNYLVHQRKDAASGVEFAEVALELMPQIPGAHVTLGFAYILTGRETEAEELLVKSLKQFPKEASVHYSHASACAMSRKLIDAQNGFEKAVELEPGNPLYQFAAGENSLKLHRHTEAERFFRAAHTMKPRHPDAGWKLAQVLGLQKRDEPAQKLFRRAVENGPPLSRRSAAFQYAVFLCERKRSAEAEPLLAAVVAQSPDHRMAWFYRARCLKQLGQKDEARAAHERYRKIQVKQDREQEEYLLGLLREQLGRGGNEDGRP